MRISHSHRNESGFTIVEIMIASAILMVLAFAISTMLFNSSKQQSKVEDRSNRADFIQGTALDLRLKPVATP